MPYLDLLIQQHSLQCEASSRQIPRAFIYLACHNPLFTIRSKPVVMISGEVFLAELESVSASMNMLCIVESDKASHLQWTYVSHQMLPALKNNVSARVNLEVQMPRQFGIDSEQTR